MMDMPLVANWNLKKDPESLPFIPSTIIHLWVFKDYILYPLYQWEFNQKKRFLQVFQIGKVLIQGVDSHDQQNDLSKDQGSSCQSSWNQEVTRKVAATNLCCPQLKSSEMGDYPEGLQSSRIAEKLQSQLSVAGGSQELTGKFLQSLLLPPSHLPTIVPENNDFSYPITLQFSCEFTEFNPEPSWWGILGNIFAGFSVGMMEWWR